MHDNFGFVGGLEDCAPHLKLFAQFFGVHDTAVVRKSYTAFAVARHKRLRVLFEKVALFCVTHVSHAHVARKRRKVVFVENLAHESLVFELMQVRVVVGNNAATLLSSVLKREHARIEHVRHVVAVVVVKPEHSAFFVEFLHFLFMFSFFMIVF